LSIPLEKVSKERGHSRATLEQAMISVERTGKKEGNERKKGKARHRKERNLDRA